jgi:hypothetical protein
MGLLAYILLGVTERPMTRGIYRTQTKESGACYVHVEYDTIAAMELTEQRYRERGYKPEFDKLPSKKDYDAAEAAKNAAEQAKKDGNA